VCQQTCMIATAVGRRWGGMAEKQTTSKRGFWEECDEPDLEGHPAWAP